MLEFSRSQNKIVFFPKNKCTNLFFYPDDSEILETWILISSLQDRKTNSFVPFFGRIYGSTILFWDLLTFRNFEIWFPFYPLTRALPTHAWYQSALPSCHCKWYRSNSSSYCRNLRVASYSYIEAIYHIN